MNEHKTLWVNGKLITPQGTIEKGSMLVDGEGKIEAIGGKGLQVEGDIPVRDLAGLTVLPGFIDVHVHGGGGHQMMDGTYESLEGMSRFHAKQGTTSFLATTTTSSQERITQALENASTAMKKGLSGAELLGIHLEGPFLNEIRRGAQNKANIRLPRKDELEWFIKASEHNIRLVTLAPEVSGGLEAAEMLIGQGITVSIGHSNATYEEVELAVQIGVNQTTHHFNGMSPLHHREPGVAGAGLMLPQLTTELIADGLHVHPAVVKLLFDQKGEHHVCLITDAVDCAGLRDGEYGRKTMKNGEIYLKEDLSCLAGSSLTMIKALQNTLERLVSTCSRTSDHVPLSISAFMSSIFVGI
jgi:N-acetylglucosamine-6-phosphate deacetylase